MGNRYYVTTPIYYINDLPHLGSAYTTIAADVMCRYKRIRGYDARFLTGTDEHGLKIQRAAQARGIKPIELADEVAAVFRDTWPKLGCVPDDFIRTSEARHRVGAQELWKRIADAGDIYPGHYSGLYCVGCEGYYTEKELTQPGNLCPIHRTPAELVREESYFFRLSKYADRLLAYYARDPSPVQPASRRAEVTSFVQSGLEDLSVSRTTFDWGIPVPGDPRHVMYVWFDALSNYWTALSDPPELRTFWPASLHLVGKDILRFHCVYWPAFLMAAGIDPPEQVFAHGFLTYGGQKMSKSLRNTVSPVALAEAISPKVGVDVVRYCLMRSISFGQDGDFSIQDVLSRYQTDLGNALGNLLNRVHPFATAVPAKGPTGDLERALDESYRTGATAAAAAFDAVSPTRALEAIGTVLAAANYYVDKSAPWTKKNDPAALGTIVATLVEVLEGVATMVAPVMPSVADRIRSQLGLEPLRPSIDADAWPFAPPTRSAGAALRKEEPIFPRLDKAAEGELVRRFTFVEEGAEGQGDKGAKGPEGAKGADAAAAGKATIAYDDFAKLDVRLGVVKSAEKVPKKDKLLDLRVDIGEPEPRRIVAGIAAAYTPEQLVGRKVVVLTNLAPRDFGKGLVSQGMLLAATGDRLQLLTVDTDDKPGSKVS